MSRGIHTKPVRGHTNDWLTPPAIIHALGTFDLDPCACPGQSKMSRTAVKMIAPPSDGLSVKWKGRVWLNPPYGDSLTPWIKRLAEHGNGIALVPARTEVESWFWPYVWEAADAVLFIRGRLYFYRPDGTKAKGNAGHGSVLVAYGQENTEILSVCEVRGRYVRLY
jgi:hypothetical protein